MEELKEEVAFPFKKSINQVLVTGWMVGGGLVAIQSLAYLIWPEWHNRQAIFITTRFFFFISIAFWVNFAYNLKNGPDQQMIRKKSSVNILKIMLRRFYAISLVIITLGKIMEIHFLGEKPLATAILISGLIMAITLMGFYLIHTILFRNLLTGGGKSTNDKEKGG